MSSIVSMNGVFVASTNDVKEERQTVIRSINSWNYSKWNSEKPVTFIPLMWDTMAVGDAHAAEPQDAINKQLLAKADCLIALFKFRLGSPTEGHESGTIEEIERFREKEKPLAVFFYDGDVPQDQLDEFNRLSDFKNELKGFSKKYTSYEDLEIKITQQLETWAQSIILPEPTCTGLRTEMDSPKAYKEWINQWNPSRQTCTLLLYNVELRTFSNLDAFQRHWGDMHQYEHIDKIVFLLPDYKMRRLKDYVGEYKEKLYNSEILSRFYICELGNASSGKGGDFTPNRITTGIGFCVLRKGKDPNRGSPFLGARLFCLSEPFCSPDYSRKPEIIWEYKHSFIVEDYPLTEKIISIWDGRYTPDNLRSLKEILIDKAPEARQRLENVLDRKMSPDDSKVLKKIQCLKDKLFDPNVPSYLMDDKFFILDWNSAFEMIFPTETFYRRQHVVDFVNCLANKQKVLERGQKYQNGIFKPSFDLEELVFQSPSYGTMIFTKQASKVKNLNEEGESGWIVALNVTNVENLGEYNMDLKATNERNSLMTDYARSYNNIISHFPPYLDLVDKHALVMQEASNILELGCGPGILTQKLLSMKKRVTAIDNNDTMLDILRKRCSPSNTLSIVKANVETLHLPNPDYSYEKIGIAPPFNGLVMMNVFFSLNNPRKTLKKIVDELLEDNCVMALSLPARTNDLNILLSEIQKFGHQKRIKPWSERDYEILAKVNRFMDNQGILTRHSENVEKILKNTGFSIDSIQENVYAGQGVFITAKVSK